jgi:hypothetical protein
LRQLLPLQLLSGGLALASLPLCAALHTSAPLLLLLLLLLLLQAQAQAQAQERALVQAQALALRCNPSCS